jgi:hypothetical protein
MVDDRHGASTFRTEIDSLSGSLLAPPALAGLVRLAPGHRLDVAVIVWLGASTGFVDVYGLRGRGIERVSPEVFAYAGSAVDRFGVDCVSGKGARLVVSSATYTERGYRVRRSFLSLRGDILVPSHRATERLTLGVRRLERLPEFAAQVPFPSCTVVDGPA